MKYLLYYLVVLAVIIPVSFAAAEDQPQWGQKHCRNMVSSEKNLPATIDVETKKNIKWVVPIGRMTYTSAIVSKGLVFIGTNNAAPRNKAHTGDRGVMMCFNEADGKFLWQLLVPKLQDSVKDWPRGGICSPATVEGDRVYTVTNRAEVVCMDIKGQANGNDGPFKNEDRFMTPPGSKLAKVTETDADILWMFDMHKNGGIWPHDAAHCSILIDGDYIYINTGNGFDKSREIPHRPDGPSLIVMDKKTGKVIARDPEPIGRRIFHGTWSSPAMGVVGGKKMIFFGGGDGVMYGFEALGEKVPEGGQLKRVWKFDCDPTGPKEKIKKYLGDRDEGPSVIVSMPVFYDGKVYVTSGGDIWWGKRQARIQCIDPSKTGDITKTGNVWTVPLNRHTSSTPSIHEGLVYVADCGRTLHCLDAATGKTVWTHDIEGEVWGSTMVADGKVYIGTRSGDFWILAAGRTKKVLCKADLGSTIHSTPTVANGVIYIATIRKLYALAKE